MKLLIAFLFVFASVNVHSQEILYSQLPVRNGFLVQNEFPKLKSDDNSLRIASKNDSCFATEDGTISNVFKLGDVYALLLKNSENNFIVFSNLVSKAVDRHTALKKGAFLGLLKKEKEYFTLNLMISDLAGKPLSKDEHRSYVGLNTSK
jgi:hypothetical protein